MPRVLVAGGTGVLGRYLVEALILGGHTVRVLSRGGPEDNPWPEAEWAHADLATGTGVAEAAGGADVVVHAATTSAFTPYGVDLRTALLPSPDVDVDGTSRLIEAAHSAGVPRLVYVSIVGIERLPLQYYRYKLHAEELVTASELDWAILRATQFHSLIDSMLQAAASLPLMGLPTNLRFQPLDPAEVAGWLRNAIQDGATGRLPDVGGPEVLSLGELAAIWLKARGEKRRLIHLPVPGKMAHAFREG
ncbi:MAG: SDR family oxidoreductase, partial [Anaerolineae bacterium]